MASFALGNAAPTALANASWSQRVAQLHELLDGGVAAYQSTRNILEGRFTPWDVFPFLPLMNFGRIGRAASNSTLGALGNAPSGPNVPLSFPPSRPSSQTATQNLINALGTPPSKGKAIAVMSHKESPIITVALAGNIDESNHFYRRLQNLFETNSDFAHYHLVPPEPPQINLQGVPRNTYAGQGDAFFEARNSCCEPKLAAALGPNTPPPEGLNVIWWGSSNNKWAIEGRTFPATNSQNPRATNVSEIAPCFSCRFNEEEIMRVLNNLGTRGLL